MELDQIWCLWPQWNIILIPKGRFLFTFCVVLGSFLCLSFISSACFGLVLVFVGLCFFRKIFSAHWSLVSAQKIFSWKNMSWHPRASRKTQSSESTMILTHIPKGKGTGGRTHSYPASPKGGGGVTCCGAVANFSKRPKQRSTGGSLSNGFAFPLDYQLHPFRHWTNQVLWSHITFDSLEALLLEVLESIIIMLQLS